MTAEHTSRFPVGPGIALWFNCRLPPNGNPEEERAPPVALGRTTRSAPHDALVGELGMPNPLSSQVSSLRNLCGSASRGSGLVDRPTGQH